MRKRTHITHACTRMHLILELERGGEDLNDNLWSAKVLIHNPQHIKKVHESYLKVLALAPHALVRNPFFVALCSLAPLSFSSCSTRTLHALHQAGADIITTSSYQATFDGFKQKGTITQNEIALFPRLHPQTHSLLLLCLFRSLPSLLILSSLLLFLSLSILALPFFWSCHYYDITM